MPYLKHIDRSRFDRELDTFPLPRTKGELNYCMTRLMLRFAREHGLYNYDRLSDAVAAAHDAGHEFRRRVLDKYEDKKARENGDVYDIYASGPATGSQVPDPARA